MEQKIIDRIFQYLDYQGIKHTAFEKEIGISNGYLGTQRKRKGDVGEGILKKIIDYCLDINEHWLITGEGEMLKTGVEVVTPDKSSMTQIRQPKGKGLVPYYEVDFYAGRSEELLDGAVVPAYYMDIPEFRGCTAFRAYSAQAWRRGISLLIVELVRI